MRRLTNWLKTNSLEGQNILESADITSLQNKVDSLPSYFLIPFFTLRGLSVINNNVSYALEYYSDINYSTLAFIYNGNKIRFEIQTYIPNVLDLIPLLSTPNVLINSVLYNVNVDISTDLLLLKTHIDISFIDNSGNLFDFSSNNFNENFNLIILQFPIT
jgi:hypothetical protein